MAGCFDQCGKTEHCYGALPAAERAARRRSDAERGRPYKSPPYGELLADRPEAEVKRSVADCRGHGHRSELACPALSCLV